MIDKAYENLKRYFAQSLIPVTETGCWLWRGARDKDGYGVLTFKGKQKRAHRIAYELYVGNIGESLLVCHKCDVKSCCNPQHLFLGTPRDNTQDMLKKGRHYEQKVTHCPKGHIYDERNTGFSNTGGRVCRTCRMLGERKRRARAKQNV